MEFEPGSMLELLSENHVKSDKVDAFKMRFYCVNLQKLIGLKKPTGRSKDIEALAQFEELRVKTAGMIPR